MKKTTVIKNIKIRTMEAYRAINNDKSLTEDQRLAALDKCAELQNKAIADLG